MLDEIKDYISSKRNLILISLVFLAFIVLFVMQDRRINNIEQTIQQEIQFQLDSITLQLEE